MPCRIVGKLLVCLRHDAVKAHCKPVRSIVIDTGAEVKALVIVVSFHDTVLVKIVHAQRIGSSIAASRYVDAVVSDDRFAQKLVIPVGITAVRPIVEVGICIAAAVTVNALFKVIIVGIVVGFHQHLCILARVCHLQYVGSLLHSHVSVVCNLCFLVALSFLSGDNYHAVGSTNTVYCRSRCVLKHAHVFNIFAVKEVDIVVEHAVNDI